MRRRPGTWLSLEELGRVRLSRHFQLRNFLYSEIAHFHGRQNLPDDPDLMITAGRQLANELLEPLVETFGPVDIRSGFRSWELNHFGATAVKPQKCAASEKDRAGHIWDHRDDAGRMGATVTVVIPWFAEQYNRGRDWRDLAWWLYDHLDLHLAQFFPKDAAFNLTWREAPEKHVLSYIAPRGYLIRRGEEPPENRAAGYSDFPPFRGICYPERPDGDTA